MLPYSAVQVALAGIGTLGMLLGLLLIGWIFKRLGRAFLGHDTPAVGASRYVLAAIWGSLLLGLGTLAWGLAIALGSWDIFASKRLVAEVQCIELGPQRLRAYFVPIDGDGSRGATESYDLEGDQWTVGGDVLRFRSILARLGLATVYRLTRVEGRWLKAEDARTHTPTAFDRAGGTTAGWLELYRNGEKGPLGWLIAGVHGQAVSQLPDRLAVFDVYVTPGGYALEKRALYPSANR